MSDQIDQKERAPIEGGHMDSPAGAVPSKLRGPRNRDDDVEAYLIELGQRVRSMRAVRGMSRKVLAQASGVSERYIAQLESGQGNVSIMLLRRVAEATGAPLEDLVAEPARQPQDWTLIRELLRKATPAVLADVKAVLGGQALDRPQQQQIAVDRVALIGLRGAGKSTLGQKLADDLGFPFIELSRQIEQFAGCTISEIQALYGQNAYRRYERRALEEAIQIYPEAVIATPGGLVSDAATFNLLLAHCTTVWLQADPEDHMKRVIAQGDMRPMGGTAGTARKGSKGRNGKNDRNGAAVAGNAVASKEAMDDLKSILSGRAAFYSKADFKLDTSAQPLAETQAALRRLVRRALKMPT